MGAPSPPPVLCMRAASSASYAFCELPHRTKETTDAMVDSRLFSYLSFIGKGAGHGGAFGGRKGGINSDESELWEGGGRDRVGEAEAYLNAPTQS
jgi:hypothetical protein